MRLTTRRALIVLFISAILLRILTHITYTPFWSADSDGYTWRWMVLSGREWQSYDGLRTPGYCAFLGLAQWLSGSPAVVRLTYASAQLAVWLQQIGGISATLLLYLLFRKLEVERRLAFGAALFFALLITVSLFEVILLPQALTSSLLIAALWLFTSAVRAGVRNARSRSLAVSSGLIFSLAAFTRAEIVIFLAVFSFVGFGVSLIFRRDPEFTALRSAALLISASAAPLLGAWIVFNGLVLGQFTLTTATGYNATCTVYNLFDRVPSRDHVFGEIMLKYYRGPSRIDLVNDAWHEVYRRASELPVKRRGPLSLNADLFAYAGQVSRHLQKRYPHVFLANAVQSFGRTFVFDQGANIPKEHVADPESPDGKKIMKSERAHDLTQPVRRIQAPIMLTFYCLTLLCVPGGLVAIQRRRFTLRDAIVFGIAVSTVATLIAFGFAHTYFPHYGMPYFGCFVLCAVVLCDAAMRSLKFRGHA